MIQRVGLTQLSNSSTSTAPCMVSDKGNCWNPLTVAALHTLPGATLKKHTLLPGGLSPALAWLTAHFAAQRDDEINRPSQTPGVSYKHTSTHIYTYPFCFLWQHSARRVSVHHLILSKLKVCCLLGVLLHSRSKSFVSKVVQTARSRQIDGEGETL